MYLLKGLEASKVAYPSDSSMYLAPVPIEKFSPIDVPYYPLIMKVFVVELTATIGVYSTLIPTIL